MRSESLLCSIPGEPPFQPNFERVVHFKGGGVSYASVSPNYFPEHSDPRFKIAIPFEGASSHTTWQTASGQRKQQYVRSGHVSIIPANLLHEVTLERRLEMIGVSLEVSFFEQIVDELSQKPIEIIENWAAQDPLIHQLGVEVRREFQLGSPQSLYLESVIQVLTTHVIRNYSTTCPAAKFVPELSPQKLQQAIAYINDQLEQDVTLSELAEVVQMSQYRFARAFRQSTGLPPHQYLLSQRIERAQTLLRETQLSIADISYKLGFASQSHFTATFRRFTAVTPTTYRKSI
jgi:AraC family transcriptional regulator